MRLIWVLLFAAALPPAARAQLTVDWFTIDGGGGTSAGGSSELSGTAGQPDAAALAGGAFGLRGGFWPVARDATPCAGDTDGDRDVDLSDLANLLAHFGVLAGAAWADGDFDGDRDVDLSDLAVLLANFGTNC